MPLWAKGIAEPLPVPISNTFGAEKDVNRLEFATMLVQGLGLPLTDKPSAGSEVFSDVDRDVTPEGINGSYFGSSYSHASGFKIYDQSHTPVQYVETAVRYGIIAGYYESGSHVFKPDKELTREEAAAILARVANLKLLTDEIRIKAELERTFQDAVSISPWAAASVLAVQRAKLIVGRPIEGEKRLLDFAPGDSLTRAEAITITYRLLKKLKKL
jgi:hypothetical protein